MLLVWRNLDRRGPRAGYHRRNPTPMPAEVVKREAVWNGVVANSKESRHSVSPVPIRAESSTLEPRSTVRTEAAPAAAKSFAKLAGASVSEPLADRRPTSTAAQARTFTTDARNRSAHASNP